MQTVSKTAKIKCYPYRSITPRQLEKVEQAASRVPAPSYVKCFCVYCEARTSGRFRLQGLWAVDTMNVAAFRSPTHALSCIAECIPSLGKKVGKPHEEEMRPIIGRDMHKSDRLEVRALCDQGHLAPRGEPTLARVKRAGHRAMV